MSSAKGSQAQKLRGGRPLHVQAAESIGHAVGAFCGQNATFREGFTNGFMHAIGEPKASTKQVERAFARAIRLAGAAFGAERRQKRA